MSSQDYLSQVRSEGTLNSSGTFTLDSSAMLGKLGKHQLPGRDYYVLKLVQSAVAGGATYIRFKTSGAGKEITFDGSPWQPEELAQLHQLVLGAPPHQRHLSHLAVALQALLASDPSHWELCSPGARLTGGGVESGPTGLAVNRLRIRWGRGPGKLAAWLQLKLFWRGRSLLFTRAKHAPIPVTLDHSYVNRHAGVWSLRRTFNESICPVRLEPDTDAHGFGYFLSSDGVGDVMGPSLTLCQGVTWWTGDLLQPETWQELPQVAEPGYGTRRCLSVHTQPHGLPGIHYGGRPALGCLALVQAQRLRLDSLLTPIYDGVALDPIHLRDFPGGHRLWVSARGLGIDLSHFKVVRDERYQRLLRSLATLVRRLGPLES